MLIKWLEKVISKLNKLTFISETNSIHSKRFTKALKKRYLVDEIYLEYVSNKNFTNKLIDSKCLVVSPLTSGISSINNSFKSPIIGICMAFEINEESKSLRIHKLLKKNILRCSAIVCDSIHIEKILKQNYNFKGRILKIAYGCDQSLFLPVKFSNNKKLRIISTRNWTDIHSNELLLDVAKVLEAKEVDYQVTFYGDYKSINKSANTKIKNLNSKKVALKGKFLNKDLPKYFGKHEIYISTSISDGTSVSLLEALSAGRICICRDFPSNREWIKHGITGFLFTDLNNLVDILIDLSTMDFDSKQRISKAARDYVRVKADWKVSEPKFLNLVSRYSA